MSDGSIAKVSRRSTRVFLEEQETLEQGKTPVAAMNEKPNEKDQGKDKSHGHARSSSQDGKPCVDLGRDICEMFLASTETIEDHVAKALASANQLVTSNREGLPLNFGTVLPGAIYRSSFPQPEAFEFLGSLGLKSIVTLVKKESPPGFDEFIKSREIEHHVIDMQGTKKVAIPDSTMKEIMKICLDKKNHPLLIHCNHGKHRTGCAAAVIRHVSGWDVESIVKEYSNFAEPKVRDCDVQYITEYKTSNLHGLFSNQSEGHSEHCTAKMLRFIGMAALILCVGCTLFKNLES